MNDTLIPFSVKIKNLREKKNLKQEELADKIGVKVLTVKRWESGKVTEANPEHIRALIKKFQLPSDFFGMGSSIMDELFTIPDDTKPETVEMLRKVLVIMTSNDVVIKTALKQNADAFYEAIKKGQEIEKIKGELKEKDHIIEEDRQRIEILEKQVQTLLSTINPNDPNTIAKEE